MSGAAGALVPLASANRLLRIMSALNLLSVIAPAVPSAPQGSSGEDASGFQDLLAEETAAPEAGTGKDKATTPDDTRADAPAVTGLLAAPASLPAPAPAPETLPPAGGSSADSDADTSPNSSVKAGTDPTTLPPAPQAPDDPPTLPPAPVDKISASKSDSEPTTLPPAPEVTAEAPDSPPTMPPVPVDKSPTPKTDNPQVLPAVSDFRPYRDEVRGNRPMLAGTVAGPAREAQAREAQASAATAPEPSVLLPAAQTPPPLRPLAERTSRLLEAAVGKTGDGTGSTGTTPAVPAAAGAVASAPAVRPAPPAPPADLLAGHEPAADGEPEAATSDLPPLSEGTSAQTQAPASTRETVVSQLSRTTVEATAQIAAQILRRLEGRSTRFEMALTPDDLGRVDVKLDIDSEGRLNARLAFDNPVAATDLRGRADELRRQLEDAGFHLADDAFEFADRDSGSSAFDRGQDARNGSSRAFAAATRLNNEIDVAQPPRWLALSLSPSGLDMKV